MSVWTGYSWRKSPFGLTDRILASSTGRGLNSEARPRNKARSAKPCLILVKVRNDPACFACLPKRSPPLGYQIGNMIFGSTPAGGRHEGFARHTGSFRGCRLHRAARPGAERWVVRQLQYGRRRHELWICDIPSMYGRGEWSWRVVFTQPVLVARIFLIAN